MAMQPYVPNPFRHPNPVIRYGAAAGAVAPALYGFRSAYNAARPIIPSWNQMRSLGRSVWPKSKPKSRTKARYGRRVFRRKKGLKKQVKELKRLAESDMGTHVDRVRNTGRVVTSAVNTSAHGSFNLVTTSTLETALANLKYYNPSVPGTLTTADGTTGTFQKEFLFQTVFNKVTLRNNYQVPCNVTLYILVPKKDTSISPFSAFTNGLTDIGAPSSTSTLVYLSDSEQFTDLWGIKKTVKRFLRPGAQFTSTYSHKGFQYDPSFVDSHTSTFQKKYGSCAFMIRVEGVIGHDTAVTTEQGTLEAGVDILYDTTLKIKYAAGADIKQIVVTDNSDTFTNNGVVSNKPVSDNQVYAIS